MDVHTTDDNSITLGRLLAPKVDDMFSYFQDISMADDSTKWKKIEENLSVWKNVMYIINSRDKVENFDQAAQKTPQFTAIQVRPIFDYLKIGAIVDILARNCKNLRYLDFTDNTLAHDELRKILSHSPQIEYLSICPFSSIASGCVQLIANNCSHLRHLVLSNSIYEESSIVDIKPLGDECPNLEHIDFSKLKHSAEDLVYIMKRRNLSLKSIWINSLCLSDVLIPFFECAYLEEIYCFFRENEDYLLNKVLQGICSSPKIKSLQFVNLCTAHPSILADFFYVNYFPNLIKLNLNSYLKVHEELRLIIKRRLPRIRMLYLSGYNYVTRHEMTCMDLLELKNLEHLELRRRRIFSPKCFRRLLNCQNLVHLNIAGSTINDTQASALVKKLQLRYLNVAECQSLTDSFLKCVPSCKSLLVLILDDCEFSKKTLDMVASKMPSTTISTTGIRFGNEENYLSIMRKCMNVCLCVLALLLIT